MQIYSLGEKAIKQQCLKTSAPSHNFEARFVDTIIHFHLAQHTRIIVNKQVHPLHPTVEYDNLDCIEEEQGSDVVVQSGEV